ncbi:MAG: phosphoribosyltransferase family protein [Aliarcobacter sp.]|nr:phosphoribosyltransferase family protein [Aliarcobacter sp.]
MEKFYYSYDLFKDDTQILVNKCRSFEPEILLAVARGGLTLSHLMAQAMNIKNLYSLNSIHYDGEVKLDTFNIFNIPDISHAKKVLIIDDIVDSGETMREIFKILKERFPNIEFKLATLFYKNTAVIKPDFSVREANTWIEFFWEVDVK